MLRAGGRAAGRFPPPGRPARRLEPAFGFGDTFDHEGFDRLGEALRCLRAEIGEPDAD
jgi:hypothetical protein